MSNGLLAKAFGVETRELRGYFLPAGEELKILGGFSPLATTGSRVSRVSVSSINREKHSDASRSPILRQFLWGKVLRCN